MKTRSEVVWRASCSPYRKFEGPHAAADLAAHYAEIHARAQK